MANNKWIWYEDIWAVKWSIILLKLFFTKGILILFKFLKEMIIFIVPIIIITHALVYATDKTKALYSLGFTAIWIVYCFSRWTKDEKN